MKKGSTRRRARAASKNGGSAARCAKCGAVLIGMPLLVQGAVAVRCRRCFGAAPSVSGHGIGSWLDRLQSGGQAEGPVLRDQEELAEAA
jgi:hypothetical protein